MSLTLISLTITSDFHACSARSLSDVRVCSCSFLWSLERSWLKNHPVWHPSGADTAMVSSFHRSLADSRKQCLPSLSPVFFWGGGGLPCWNEVHTQSTAAHVSLISPCGSLCVCVSSLKEGMRFSLRQYLPPPTPTHPSLHKSPNFLFLLTLPVSVCGHKTALSATLQSLLFWLCDVTVQLCCVSCSCNAFCPSSRLQTAFSRDEMPRTSSLSWCQRRCWLVGWFPTTRQRVCQPVVWFLFTKQ